MSDHIQKLVCQDLLFIVHAKYNLSKLCHLFHFRRDDPLVYSTFKNNLAALGFSSLAMSMNSRKSLLFAAIVPPWLQNYYLAGCSQVQSNTAGFESGYKNSDILVMLEVSYVLVALCLRDLPVDLNKLLAAPLNDPLHVPRDIPISPSGTSLRGVKY